MTKKEIQIIVKIEVLEVAAALISGHGETGGEVWDSLIDQLGDKYDIYEMAGIQQSNLASQLNNRANKIRIRHGYSKNDFKYTP